MRLAQSVIGIAGWGLAGLAAVSLLLGLWLAGNALAFRSDVVRTTGRVLDYRESPTSDGRVFYTPRIAYTDHTGSRREMYGQLSAAVKRFPENAEVPIRYLESDPARARVDIFVDNWLGATLALGLGVLTGLAALLLVRSSQRELAR